METKLITITLVSLVTVLAMVPFFPARAYFSDTESSLFIFSTSDFSSSQHLSEPEQPSSTTTVVTFSAGTVDIAVNGQNPWTETYEFTSMTPGLWGDTDINITNGNNDITYKISAEWKSDSQYLFDAVKVEIWDINSGILINDASKLLKDLDTSPRFLSSGKEEKLRFKIKLRDDADNSYKNLTTEFTLTVTATQARNTGIVIYVPDEYLTIQAAVDAADPGDIIIVRDGTYTENINVNKSHLTIKSENGAEKTIVQGAVNSNNSVFEVVADYVNISGLTVRRVNGAAAAGIYLLGANHSTISDNIASNILLNWNNYGIHLSNSSRNTITNNIVSNNRIGIHLYSSGNNTIINNNAFNNDSGIYLSVSGSNTIANNIASNNNVGVYLNSSTNNTVINNKAFNNGTGIHFLYSHNNIFTNNTVLDSRFVGVSFVNSRGSKLYNNNFVDNPIQIEADTQSLNNIFNLASPIGGNYWSDYNAPAQGCIDANSDGFCDAPHVFTGGQDNLPWIKKDGWITPPNQPPTCVIKLQKDGVEINEINAEEFFDIYVGSSTDDTGIKEVRFSSDDSQNGIPDGEWTEWYDWSTSSGDWNTVTKTKMWSFATEGEKEVWVTVKDEIDQIDKCFANIKTYYSPNPYGYSFQNRGVLEDNPHTNTDEGLTDDSKWIIFKNTFDLMGVDLSTQERWFREIDARDFGGGGNCYGMTVSSLMEYEYPGYDLFLENQGKNTIFELEEPVIGEWCWPFHPYCHVEWDGSGDILAKLLLKHIIEFQVSWWGIPNEEKIMGTENVWNALRIGLPQEMYVLGIYDEGQGHALIPFSFETVAEDQEYRVFVYDPNHPNEEEHTIMIRRNFLGNWSWEYDLGWVTWSGPSWWGISGDDSIELIPITVAYNGGNRLRLPGTTDEQEATVFLSGDANLFLTDSEGRVAGLKDSSVIEEIPNVKLIFPVAILPSGVSGRWKPAFHMSSDTGLGFIIEKVDNADEKFVMLKLGSGYLVEFSASVGERVSKVYISNDGTDISISGQENDYTLFLNKDIHGVSQTFIATNIPSVSVTVHKYTIDWQTLSQGEEGVTLQIDADGDGVFEKTVNANNNLTYDEFILQTETIIDFDPDTLNLKSKGEFVTIYIEFPEGYEVSQIDIPSIMLNNLVSVLFKPTEIGDYDSDGTPDLMVKFDRSKIQTILSPGNEVLVTITGKVFHNGSYIDFKGSNIIGVIDLNKGKK